VSNFFRINTYTNARQVLILNHLRKL